MANITNDLEKIKSAVYGNEVRQSIHDAIKTCYDDASMQDNANMEVKLARGIYDTLNDRLGNNDIKFKSIDEQFISIKNDATSNIKDTNDKVRFIHNEINQIGCETSLFDDISTTITDDNYHNAFTSMVKFNDKYVLVYRKGSDHNSYDGKLVMKTSTDLTSWSEETVIFEQSGFDYRDVNLIVFNNKLVLKFAKRWGDDLRKAYISYTIDLSSFSQEVELPVIESGYCSTRGDMAIYNNELYCILYGLWDSTYLVKSSNLTNWTIVTKLLEDTNEASIVYYNNIANQIESKFIAIFRPTSNAFEGYFKWGESTDGINWTYKDLTIRTHCPTIKLMNLTYNANILCVLYRDPSLLKTGLNRSCFNMAFLNSKGELIRSPYNLFYSSNTFDNGYGDLVETDDSIYISCYVGNGTTNGDVRIVTLNKSKIVDYINYNKKHNPVTQEKITYINASGVVSSKNKYNEILGDTLITFENEKEKEFTIDLTNLNITNGALNLVGIYPENKFYSIRINSVTNTEITGKVIYDNTTSNYSLRVRYYLIHRG